ncbi:hypothetical protein [Nakamurella lactea]|uniref:hypothetical protein n=1 Tax=Nakamurella lactea TaxID=459515 RepID=UPI0004283D4E|nr:hypothetical protein [Nakamurella lactea]
MTAPQDPSAQSTPAAESAAASEEPSDTIERPGEPDHGPGDEVVDGEVVDGEVVDGGEQPDEAPDAAGDDGDDEAVDADLVDAAPGETADVPAETSAGQVTSPVAAPVAAPTFVAPVAPPAFDYTDEGVPTLDYVRDKIEGRWGTAMGSTELAQESQAGRKLQDAADERARLAAEKLAELRRQVDGGSKG